VEPSGLPFNAPVFDKRNRPHNPMVNAGAMMISTLLVNEGKTIEDFMDFYMRASSSTRADIDLPLYKEEALTGTTNHALRSLMLSRGIYPVKPTFEQTKQACIAAFSRIVCVTTVTPPQLADEGLDFYFIQCSMLVDVQGLARFGAMLSNGGVNPNTGERIISHATVQAAVTLMQTCGMYDGAGNFAFFHGAPSKSGVSGGLLTVIPGVGAVGSFSPLLNDEGNSVRAIGMIEQLSARYSNVNLFDKDSMKRDLTRRPYQTILETTIASCSAASLGDFEAIARLHAAKTNLSAGDYDLRTPLHLASHGSHLEIVRFLVEEEKVDVNARDRWGSTPLDDATRKEVREILIANGAVGGTQQVRRADTCVHCAALAPLVMPPQASGAPRQTSLTDDDFRLFYAAYDNDVLLMQSLNILGWHVSFTGHKHRAAQQTDALPAAFRSDQHRRL
jgi:glutaminase